MLKASAHNNILFTGSEGKIILLLWSNLFPKHIWSNLHNNDQIYIIMVKFTTIIMSNLQVRCTTQESM